MVQTELHPLCTLFPRMTDAEFNALCKDLTMNGLREPIVLHDGMILDGGNRYRACMESGIKPHFIEFKGPSIAAFVLSANLHRRHLSPGQQAVIVASVQDWRTAQSHGGDRGNQHGGPSQTAMLPLASVADRAAQSGASERTQRMADMVAKQSPELAQQVARGEISLPKAVQQIEPIESAENTRAPSSVGNDRAKAVPVHSHDGDDSNPKPNANQRDNTSLAAQVEQLKFELEAAKNGARELAHSLESYEAVSQGEHAIAKEMAILRKQLATVEGTRDQYMNTCAALRREVKSLQCKVKMLAPTTPQRSSA